MSDLKTVVLGSGGWGTAIAAMLSDNGHEVSLWSVFEQEADMLSKERINPLLPGVRIPEEITITSDIGCCRGANIIVMATPSFAVRETAAKLAGYAGDKAVIVSVSKGIERETSMRLSEVIRKEIGDMSPVVALSGPSHAEEVGRKIATGCVAASADIAAAELVQDAFMNKYFRVYASSDIVGVELGGALKNVIALCSGICDGMGLGDNTKAILMTRGLTEIARLGVRLGGRKETFGGLAGVGDLIVTCTSMHSRNRRAGILIGQGKTPKEAMKEVGAVVEGYYAAAAAKTLAYATGVEMPICREAYATLYEGKDVHIIIEELMTRSKKHEIEESWA